MSVPIRVVVADPLSSTGIDMLREHLDVVQPVDEDTLFAVLPGADALVVRSRTQVTKNILNLGRQLQIVARAGIGIDNIDVDAATVQGVLVINAPLGNVRSTAEHSIALMFALARRVPAADRAVRDGSWKTGYEGVQIAGRRLGIVGVGKVGRQVAAMAVAIGMDVVAYDPYVSEDAWADLALRAVPFDGLIESSDFITVHVPLLDETRGLIGEAEIARMKSGSYLINCARGGLVDERALAQALNSGHLAGAALDVFVQEPLRDSPLLTCPNAILTPHVAASTREAQAQVSTDIAQQLIDFFAGRPVAYPINPSVLRKAAV